MEKELKKYTMPHCDVVTLSWGNPLCVSGNGSVENMDFEEYNW